MNSFWNYFRATTNYDLVGIKSIFDIWYIIIVLQDIRSNSSKMILDFGCLILQIIDEDFVLFLWLGCLGLKSGELFLDLGRLWWIIFPLEKQIIDLKYLVVF